MIESPVRPWDGFSRSLRRLGELCLLLLFAAAMRVWFFPAMLETMEFAAAMPARQIAAGSLTPEHFASYRYGLVYPLALSFRLFGENFFSLSLYSFLCSMGSLLVAYVVARKLAGDYAGLAAVYLLAILPMDIELAGRPLPDGPQAFFAALGMWLFYSSSGYGRSWKVAAGLASGVLLGLSYLCKVTTVFLVPVLVVWALFRKSHRLSLLLVGGGFLAVLAAEAMANYLLIGDPLAQLHSTYTAVEGGKEVKLAYASNTPDIYLKKFFLLPVKYGLQMYVAVGAIIYLIRREAGKHLFLLLWLAWFFGYSWLGTVSLSSYRPLSQFERYLAIIHVPLVVLTAVGLTRLKPRWQWTAFVAMGLAAVFMGNLQLAEAEGTRAMERIATELRSRAAKFPIYVNVRSDRMLAFLLGSDNPAEIIPYGVTPTRETMMQGMGEVTNAYIVVDRNTMEEGTGRYVDERYPPEIFSPPPHWREVFVVDNPGRSSCYAQMRLIRWLAQLPIVPIRFSEKIVGIADARLEGRDAVLYFAEAHVGNHSAKPSDHSPRPAPRDER